MDPQAEEPEHPKHHRSRDFLVTTTPSPFGKMHFGLFSGFSCSSLLMSLPQPRRAALLQFSISNCFGKVNLAKQIKSTMKELAICCPHVHRADARSVNSHNNSNSNKKFTQSYLLFVRRLCSSFLDVFFPKLSRMCLKVANVVTGAVPKLLSQRGMWSEGRGV